jgi:hypothetical protein
MLKAETVVHPQRPGLPNTPSTYDEFDRDIRLFALPS